MYFVLHSEHHLHGIIWSTFYWWQSVYHLRIISKDNGLSPIHYKANAWINIDLFLIATSGANFNQNLIKIQLSSLNAFENVVSKTKWPPSISYRYSTTPADDRDNSNSDYCQTWYWPYKPSVYCLSKYFGVSSKSDEFHTYQPVKLRKNPIISMEFRTMLWDK